MCCLFVSPRAADTIPRAINGKLLIVSVLFDRQGTLEGGQSFLTAIGASSPPTSIGASNPIKVP